MGVGAGMGVAWGVDVEEVVDECGGVGAGVDGCGGVEG